MKNLKSIVALAMSLFMLVPASLFASSHREAPITALDRSADVTDWYAFVSYDHPDKVTFILNVDPLLEPANGPNYFPFDDNVVYQMLVDNNQDGIPDVTFQFRFTTQIRNPNLFTGFVGGIAGIPPITSLHNGTGSEGLSLRQTYTVTMIKNGVSTVLNNGQTLYAVPSNVGPLTMPNYQGLFNQGIRNLTGGFRVWAGTADDPFFIDLGAFFDSVNFRHGTGPVLSSAIDGDDTHNYAPDAVGGYNVNSIVLEVPIQMLTVDGKIHPASDKRAVIGSYGSTARHAMTVRSSPTSSFTPRTSVRSAPMARRFCRMSPPARTAPTGPRRTDAQDTRQLCIDRVEPVWEIRVGVAGQHARGRAGGALIDGRPQRKRGRLREPEHGRRRRREHR